MRKLALLLALMASALAWAQPRGELAEGTTGDGGWAAIAWTFGYLAIGIAGWLFFKHTSYRQRETLTSAFWTLLVFAAAVSIVYQLVVTGRVNW